MNVDVSPVSTRLQLRLNTGLDEDLNPIYRTRSYSRVRPEADNGDLFELALGIEGLQQHTINAVRRVDEVELTEQ